MLVISIAKMRQKMKYTSDNPLYYMFSIYRAEYSMKLNENWKIVFDGKIFRPVRLIQTNRVILGIECDTLANHEYIDWLRKHRGGGG